MSTDPDPGLAPPLGGWQHPLSPPPGTGRSCLGGAGQGCQGPSCFHPSQQDEGPHHRNQTDMPNPLRPGEDNTERRFHLRFSATEPLGTEAPAHNSDNLIQNKAFLLVNEFCFSPNPLRDAYPHICSAKHWAGHLGRDRGTETLFSLQGLIFQLPQGQDNRVAWHI